MLVETAGFPPAAFCAGRTWTSVHTPAARPDAASSAHPRPREGLLVTTPRNRPKAAGRMTRRGALKLAAASAVLPLVHIRSGRAAGKVSIAFWDHWVPSGNAVMQKQVAAWGAKNQVEVQADFITSVGQKNLLTIAAEAQAKTGHDVQAFPTWEVHNNAGRAGTARRRDEAADRASTVR